jgi:hypothetical protein
MFPHLPALIDNYSIFFHKLDLMGVQEVRWDKRGTVRAGDYAFFFYGKTNENHLLGTGFFCAAKNGTSR